MARDALTGDEPSTSTPAWSIAVPSRLRLTVTEGPCRGQGFDSASANSYCLQVGRVKKAKIYIKDVSISEKHAELAWDGSSWTVRDIGSSNGTRMNGGPSLQPFQAHALKSGDLLSFGSDTVVEVQLEPQMLRDVTLEALLRAHCESRCQDLENASTREAHEMVRRCHEALDALLPAQA